MLSWTFYPVIIGTIASIMGLGRIAITEKYDDSPTSLSELAAAEEVLLRRFRNILLCCGILFAITLFGFIVPRTNHPVAIVIFGALMIGGELLAAITPARGKTSVFHTALAQTMAVGMLGLAVVFAIALTGIASMSEIALTASMIAFASLTFADKKRYIAYELAFIFSSHFSVVVAALALR